jgi:hypothetical protein
MGGTFQARNRGATSGPHSTGGSRTTPDSGGRPTPQLSPTLRTSLQVVRPPRFSLARRKSGVQIPSPPPPTSQVRASPASSGRRSLQVAAALRPQAQVAVQPGRLSETRRHGHGSPTMTTERGRRLQPELRAPSDTRQSGREAPLAPAAGRDVRGDGRTARPGPLLAVWLPAAPTRSTMSPVQPQWTRTRNARTPTRDTGRPHPDIGQRTRGHRGHWTVTPDAWTRRRTRTGRPRHGRHPDILDHHDHPTAHWDAEPWTCGRRLRRSATMTARRR